MCSLCWEAYSAGYMTRTEVWQCVYYLDIIRSHRDEPRRIPKRDPDDPRYVLKRGEGLLPFMYTIEEEDFYFYEIWRWVRRRKLHRLKIAGKGADAPEERAARGVEDETIGWPKLHDFNMEVK